MLEELKARVEALEEHLFGAKCNTCDQRESSQLKCQGCQDKFCKCNTFYREDDTHIFCSSSCLRSHLERVIRETGCCPLCDSRYKDDIMEKYTDRL